MKTLMMKGMGLPTCEQIEQFAYAYLEGELDPGLTAKFERHLGGCDNCERFVSTYREVARPERLLQKIPLDQDFERRMIEFLKKNRYRFVGQAAEFRTPGS